MRRPSIVVLIITFAIVAAVVLKAHAVAGKSPVDSDSLRGISGIEKTPRQSKSFSWLPWVALIVVVAAGVGLIAWKYRRPSQPMPTQTAEDWALAELSAIDALELPMAGESERYHTLVSAVVRRYLELRFQVHAPQQTTQEFLRAAEQLPAITVERQTMVRAILERCDVAKFAPGSVAEAECAKTAALARSIVHGDHTQ